MIVTRHSQGYPTQQDLSGTFAGLMDIYERNYIGVRRLAPCLPAEGGRRVSEVGRGLSLHLTVLERFRYTSEISLTYYFLREQRRVAEPDLRIRVYHDARLAEVMAAHLRHWPAFHETHQSDISSHLHARWHVNRFLYKWLNYCLHQGHHFRETD